MVHYKTEWLLYLWMKFLPNISRKKGCLTRRKCRLKQNRTKQGKIHVFLFLLGPLESMIEVVCSKYSIYLIPSNYFYMVLYIYSILP